MMRKIALAFIALWYCLQVHAQGTPFILVLGTAQDGGYPHLGCSKICCSKAWDNPGAKRHIVSLALADPASGQWWLLEATPDIREQLQLFRTMTDSLFPYLPSGIFITHAHIGHYTGLMQLGREVMGAKEVPVYVLPKLKTFIETNGPWQQLVTLRNITLHVLTADTPLIIGDNISVTAYKVPHRDEYSETAGFKIITSSRKYLFIPDINKWNDWDKNIITEVGNSDIALLDATFYDTTELPGRRLTEVPHPFITETISLFRHTDSTTKSKIHFIHFNHTNPMLWDEEKRRAFGKSGFHLAEQGQKL